MATPEEGTEAAKMDYPDHEIAVRRAELLEMIQSEIMDEYNASMIGWKDKREACIYFDGNSK